MKREKHEAAGNRDAASIDKSAAPRPDMLIEGDEAVALYTRKIASNLTDLEAQVTRLREECLRAKKLLSEIG